MVSLAKTAQTIRTQLYKGGQLVPLIRKIYQDVKSNDKNPTEIDILVPWGKISGLWWGPKDRQPILALHGWQDTAGTFETLIPMLPSNTSVLAIDLPGHGRSDWLPAGMLYSLLDSVVLVHRISNFFGWSQTKLLGHSMGSMVTFCYATYFPDKVQFAIGLDLIKPASIDVERQAANIADQANDILRVEARLSEPPGYTYEELMNKWIIGTNNSVDETACKILMKRGATKKPDGKYCFSKDPRLIKFTSFDMGYTHNHILELAKRISCPYMILKADNSPYYQDKQYVFDTIDVMRANNSEFSFDFVEGKHHVHLTHPERVANKINPFLEKYNS